MGIFDPLFTGLKDIIQFIDTIVESVTNPTVNDEQASDEIAQQFENLSPTDEVAATLVDIVEESIIADLEEQGEIDPENVEALLDGVEGQAVGTTLALGLAGTAVEASSLGQVDQQQEFLMQAAAALQLDDAAGGELKARIAEGVEPALTAKVTAEHRAKFVDLQDAVEYALRNKQADSDYLSGSKLPDEIASDLRPDEPVTEDNLIEQYGIRDDQLRTRPAGQRWRGVP